MDRTPEQEAAIASANARLAEIERARLAGNRAADEREMTANMTGAGMKGTSTYNRVAANMGAGVQDMILGAKQIYQNQFGSDEDKKDIERQILDHRAISDAMAKTIRGGGASQVAGNIMPTLAIPVGGFSNAGMQVLRSLPRAYQAARTLGRPAAAVAQTVTKPGKIALAVDSVLAGGSAGYLQPVAGEESRLMNTGVGATLGAVPPAVGLGARTGYQWLTKSGKLQRAGRRAAEEVSSVLGNVANEAKGVVGKLGGSADDVIEYLKQALEKVRTADAVPTPGGIPLSTAARTQDPGLARLEIGSRANDAPSWFPFDTNQASAVNKAFLDATDEATQLAARKGDRATNWKAGWEAAEEGADLPMFADKVSGLKSSLNDMMKSPDAVNPKVMAMISQVQKIIDDLGENITPAHLQQIRANLSGKFNPNSTSAFESVSRDTPSTIKMLKNIDEILESVTGGKWSPVTQGYKTGSDLVRQSQAAGKMRASYYDPITGRVRGVVADADVPKITEAGFGRALDTTKGTLSDAAQVKANAILEALRLQALPQRLKKTATAGGGSDTVSNNVAVGAAKRFINNLPGGELATGLVEGAASRSDDLKNKVLADALQSPAEMMKLLEAQIKRGQPLTQQQLAVYGLLRSLAPGAQAGFSK
jgi:hypothetical protein